MSAPEPSFGATEAARLSPELQQLLPELEQIIAKLRGGELTREQARERIAGDESGDERRRSLARMPLMRR
jgi:hypothetical protein